MSEAAVDLQGRSGQPNRMEWCFGLLGHSSFELEGEGRYREQEESAQALTQRLTYKDEAGSFHTCTTATKQVTYNITLFVFCNYNVCFINIISSSLSVCVLSPDNGVGSVILFMHT